MPSESDKNERFKELSYIAATLPQINSKSESKVFYMFSLVKKFLRNNQIEYTLNYSSIIVSTGKLGYFTLHFDSEWSRVRIHPHIDNMPTIMNNVSFEVEAATVPQLMGKLFQKGLITIESLGMLNFDYVKKERKKSVNLR